VIEGFIFHSKGSPSPKGTTSKKEKRERKGRLGPRKNITDSQSEGKRILAGGTFVSPETRETQASGETGGGKIYRTLTKGINSQEHFSQPAKGF